VPTEIPPIVPGPVLDPERLRRALTAGPAGPARGDPLAVDRILAAAEVDDPAVAVHQPPPRYPPALRLAGIEGRVLVEFVIDTTGHLERASFRILERAHQGFEASALETLERSVFKPARMGGRAVRQRTLQSIAFRIRPD
jgi:protein TonB